MAGTKTKLNQILQDGATTGQLLRWDGTSWAPVTRSVSTTGSLNGGGSLASDRTLSLVNDNTTPGNGYFYGTNTLGTKGFYLVSDYAGDIRNGGNTTGASIMIGTNDNFSLSLETNGIIRQTIDTSGQTNLISSTSNTNSTNTTLTLTSESAFTVGNGFGGRILFQGESDAGTNRFMGSIASQWINAVDASRTAEFVFTAGTSGSGTEVARINGNGITTGPSSTVFFNSNGLSASTSTNTITLAGGTQTLTSLSKSVATITGNYAAASGSGVLTSLSLNPVYNLTGTTGAQIGLDIAPTFTALSGTFRGINMPYNNSSSFGIYQSGANTLNYFNGKVGFGTSAPGEMLSLGLSGTTLGVMSFAGSTSGKVIVQPAAAAGTWTMTLPTTAGSSGQVLSTDGAGVTSWITASSGGTPGGSNTHVQFNDSGVFGGQGSYAYDKTNLILKLGTPSSGTGRLVIKGSDTAGTNYALQTYNSSDVLRTQVTNNGYNQAIGLSMLNFDLTGYYKAVARIQQPFDIPFTDTSGTITMFDQYAAFQPTSGTAVFNSMAIATSVTQTGGANGITRGLYLDGALSSTAADFRALETTYGKVIFGGPIGVRLPSATTTQRTTISDTTNGVILYDSTLNKLYGRENGAWVALTVGGGIGITDGDKGDVTVSSSGTVWTVDNLAITNAKINDVSVAKLTSGTLLGGIDIRVGAASNMSLSYTNTNSALFISNSGNSAILSSQDATQYVSVDNISTLIGSGGSALEFRDGVTRFWDSDMTQYVGIQTPATASLTTSYTMTLPTSNAAGVLTNNGSGTLTWASASGLADGGNSTGAAITIGTNDAFGLNLETNSVTRIAITGAASTGGATTITNVNTNTNSPFDVLTISGNSTSVVSTNYGTGILFKGESDTTNDRDLVRIAGVWTSAVDATRTSKLSFQTVSSGTLAERAFINAFGLTVGTTTEYRESSIQDNSGSFTVASNGGGLTLNSGSGSINLTSTSNTGGVGFGLTAYTSTTLSKKVLTDAQSYTAASGVGTYTSFEIAPTFNLTGSASGTQRGVYVNPAITSLTGVYRAIDIAVDHSNARGIYQSGTNTINNIVGNTLFGGTGTPLEKVSVTGNMVVNGQYYSNQFSLTDGATIALNWNNGNVQRVVLGGNRTFTFSNPKTGGRYLIVLKQDATGSRTVTWPTIKWRGGTAPTLTTGANKVDLITIVFDGTDYFGDASLNY